MPQDIDYDKLNYAAKTLHDAAFARGMEAGRTRASDESGVLGEYR